MIFGENIIIDFDYFSNTLIDTLIILKLIKINIVLMKINFDYFAFQWCRNWEIWVMREYKEEQENICLTDARSFASILIKGATDRRLAPVRV